MVFWGHITDGKIILDQHPELPNGTKVRVEVVEEREFPSIAEVLKSTKGGLRGLPEDFSEQHDHYIHGAPKR